MLPSRSIRLFHSFDSSSSWRVRIALSLKKIEYGSVPIALESGENRKDSYRKVNPVGQVPTLEVDGRNVSQSMAIIEYLDEMYPQPPLLPDDEFLRASVREIAEIVNAGIQPLHNGGLNRSYRDYFKVTNDQLRQWKKYWIKRRFAALEKKLAKIAGRYCVGESVSLADLFLFPQVNRACSYGVDAEQYPTIAAVVKELSEIPDFVETGPKEPSSR